jgi:hypothetical protein
MAIQISKMVLGMSEDVARLELGRYENHVGHRFEGSEIPDLIENVHASVLAPVVWDANVFERSTSIGSIEGTGSHEEERNANYDRKEEAFRLRKTILRLGQRLSKLSISRK